MKEEALNIVIKLIDGGRISGKDAITLTQAILDRQDHGYSSIMTPSPISVKDINNPSAEINPYKDFITTSTSNINNEPINATSPKKMEVIYG